MDPKEAHARLLAKVRSRTVPSSNESCVVARLARVAGLVQVKDDNKQATELEQRCKTLAEEIASKRWVRE
jgi:hypothetical protein